VIVAGASPGETKMWAVVRRNGIAWPPCIAGLVAKRHQHTLENDMRVQPFAPSLLFTLFAFK